MSKSIIIGVAGAGVFGGYHSGKCAAHPHITFAGSFDPDTSRAKDNVRRHGGKVFSTFEAMCKTCDAVILATPATAHGPMAKTALSFDCHVLIEKPIADNLLDAKDIVETARQKNLTVQIGHQERFVIRAIGLDGLNETPTRIRSWRMTPFSLRGTDVSVALDLLIHDIDLALWLMRHPPVSVTGDAVAVRSEHADAAIAFIKNDNAQARLEASRVSDTPKRRMILDYTSGSVDIDFNAKTLTNTTGFALNTDFGNSPDAKDSLGAAVNAFVNAIFDQSKPLISAQDGLNALQVALKTGE